jgi:hypothetical protein
VDKPTQKRLQREAARLIREGKMPSLEEVCAAVLETRKEYRLKILRARREARGAFAKPK